MSRPLRILFFGTGGLISQLAFKAIVSNHNVVAVVCDTRPGQTASKLSLKQRVVSLGRSWFGAGRAQSLEEMAKEHGIPFHHVRTVNNRDVISTLKEYDADLICIASFNRIIKQAVLDIPRMGVINAHSSLLPDYRGANPFFWMVKDGNFAAGGCTLHRAEAKVDSGQIYMRRPIRIYSGMTASDYSTAVALAAGELYLDLLAKIENGEALDGEPNGTTVTPACRNPHPEDVRVDRSYTMKHAIWFHRVASEHGTPFIECRGKTTVCRLLKPKPFEGAAAIQFADGKLWAKE